MANLALVLDNLADAGTVTASAELSGSPASNLISSPHVWDDQWRATGDTATITCDLGSDMPADTVAAMGLSLSDQGAIRVRVSRTTGNDSYTKVLLHMDGSDASTTFTDSNAGGSAHT